MKSSLVYSMHGFEYNDPVRTYRETVEQVHRVAGTDDEYGHHG